MSEKIQFYLKEPNEHQMLPFSSLLKNGYLYAASRDGRLFCLNSDDYSIKKVFWNHNSWISSLCTSNNYVITGSYDGHVVLYDNETIEKEETHFYKKKLFNDYIISMYLDDNTLISSSSDQFLKISEIINNDIVEKREIKLKNTCHAIHLENNFVFCGFCDGNISVSDLREENFTINEKPIVSSPIKAIHREDNTLQIGCLDGTVKHIDTRTFHEIKSFQGNDRVLSIQKLDDKIFTFFGDGKVLDSNGKIIEFTTNKCTSCFFENSDVLHYCDSFGTLHKIVKGEERNKLQASTSIVKMCRLRQNTDILMKDSENKVFLVDGCTFKVKEDFGEEDFNKKMKDLSSNPLLYFPASYDTSTGMPRVILTNYLPKIVGRKQTKERKALASFVKGAIDSKLNVLCTDSNSIPKWTSTADKHLPNWMKYALNMHLPYD